MKYEFSEMNDDLYFATNLLVTTKNQLANDPKCGDFSPSGNFHISHTKSPYLVSS